MAVRKYSLPDLHNSNRTAHYLIGETRDLFDMVSAMPSNRNNRDDWAGGMTRAELTNALGMGHLPSVAPSDAFLASVENLFPCPTVKNTIVNDVAGGFPNVPAMLAGFPLAMRRKQKQTSESSPIAIVVNTTTSGAISETTMQKRGAVILALVRALSNRRPVELYTGTGLGADGNRNGVYQLYRIETAPLDLARAAFMLSHVAATRNAQYQIGYEHYGFGGGWPQGRTPIASEEQATFARALPHVTDMLYIPSCYGNSDSVVADPVKWITEHVAAYGDNVNAEAA